ncbi:MAG: helix-turn-helix transcriptional regulator, partial [Bacteroidota bacterium]|nr:helix-turn-helix transcriptional regulator [Bacteroidota bacterium]
MSFFGVNIKKIRVVKKLNQTQFADLFDLTRSAIGAYEEGRAEAKIDKIIEIAEYFGLSLDKFLRKKITINEILKYDEKKVIFSVNTHFNSVPFVESKKVNQYIKNITNKDFVDRLPKIVVPFFSEKSRAFEINDNQCFLNSEIVICSLYDGKPRNNDWFLMVAKDKIEIEEKITSRKKYHEIWRIENIYIKNIFK